MKDLVNHHSNYVWLVGWRCLLQIGPHLKHCLPKECENSHKEVDSIFCGVQKGTCGYPGGC